MEVVAGRVTPKKDPIVQETENPLKTCLKDHDGYLLGSVKV